MMTPRNDEVETIETVHSCVKDSLLHRLASSMFFYSEPRTTLPDPDRVSLIGVQRTLSFRERLR